MAAEKFGAGRAELAFAARRAGRFVGLRIWTFRSKNISCYSPANML